MAVSTMCCTHSVWPDWCAKRPCNKSLSSTAVAAIVLLVVVVETDSGTVEVPGNTSKISGSAGGS